MTATTIAELPKTARERGKIAPAKFAHVVLRSKNIARLIEFYKTVLEAEATYGDNNAAFLTYDDEHHRVAVVQMPGLFSPSRGRVGMDHFAFTYATLGDLLATYKRLKGEGILPVWTTNHGVTFSFYYQDPDKNVFELQIDVFDNPEELHAYFMSEDFNNNPIGVDFDADNILARFEAGEPEEQLLYRNADGPRDMKTMPREIIGTFNWLMIRVLGVFGIKPIA
ncbi:MAG: VOC family protein [Pseudomonadota bacterium]